MRFERLLFSELRETNPDRFEKADLAATSILEDEPGRFAVQRGESENTHVVALVTAYGEPWGRCSCDGYEHHDGPCSHLCAVWRAEQTDLVDIPPLDPTAIEGDVRGRQQCLADRAAEPDQRARADGGEHL